MYIDRKITQSGDCHIFLGHTGDDPHKQRFIVCTYGTDILHKEVHKTNPINDFFCTSLCKFCHGVLGDFQPEDDTFTDEEFKGFVIDCLDIADQETAKSVLRCHIANREEYKGKSIQYAPIELI